MTVSHENDSPTPDDAAPAPAPLNRAERRAKRKGKAGNASAPTLFQKDQRRSSQVVAQPKYRGRRGNK
ncbi:hypothetical protein [Phytoactinopolyspora halotolerans]|uniref:Uncharacterized protein n=1 Tax=Phytoactinopolyspora halotolerans TaxID=1981512 RepID=A0A6L9S8K2_9ACTN|nr:hypothetical protein [Phytoactinopolyspora halotolerans]NEE01546.1 hypothetical protein [Phytoactinopolyspora halotolerans]